MPKLTKNYIDKITAPADKEAFHWDDSLKGFGLRVTPTGKITYIVQGRVNGSSPRISIGPHGVFTVDQARDVAREHLRSMRMGIDPRAVAKKEAAQRVTLRDVADGYKRDRPLKDSSKAEIERHVTTTFEAWLKKPLRDINREMVTKRFNDIKNKGTRGDGPAPAQANQSMAVLRALFNYAIREYREPVISSQEGVLGGSRMDAVPAAPAANKAEAKRSAGAEERLGTGHGERLHAPARQVEFRKASERPDEIITVYYDSLENLRAQGIIPRLRQRPVPNPFPTDQFVPDPS